MGGTHRGMRRLTRAVIKMLCDDCNFRKGEKKKSEKLSEVPNRKSVGLITDA